MTGIVRRPTLGAAAVVTLTAGCTLSAGSAAGQSDSTGTVKLEDLPSAPVPHLCAHDPGNLVNKDFWVTFGDLTGDEIDDGAFVTACSAGGVPWPATVQLYTAGPTRLGGVDLSDLTHGGRETVTGLRRSWLRTSSEPTEDFCHCGVVAETVPHRVRMNHNVCSESADETAG